MTFKPGDRVRCIDNDNGNYCALTIGEVYTVVFASHNSVGIHTDESEYYDHRFVRANEHTMDDQEYNDILAAQSIMDTLTNG